MPFDERTSIYGRAKWHCLDKDDEPQYTHSVFLSTYRVELGMHESILVGIILKSRAVDHAEESEEQRYGE